MRIVLCNGVFDLLHPGHVAHLQEARSFGDFLIVSLTLDQYVNKGPQRPIHKWEDRALLLRALRCVDAVIPSMDGVDALLKVRPHIFAKGKDYIGNNRFIDGILEACTTVGAEIRYTSTPKMSSAEIIRKTMGDHVD